MSGYGYPPVSGACWKRSRHPGRGPLGTHRPEAFGTVPAGAELCSRLRMPSARRHAPGSRGTCFDIRGRNAHPASGGADRPRMPPTGHHQPGRLDVERHQKRDSYPRPGLPLLPAGGRTLRSAHPRSRSRPRKQHAPNERRQPRTVQPTDQNVPTARKNGRNRPTTNLAAARPVTRWGCTCWDGVRIFGRQRPGTWDCSSSFRWRCPTDERPLRSCCPLCSSSPSS